MPVYTMLSQINKKTLKYFQNSNTNVAAFIFVIVQPKIFCHNLDIFTVAIILGTFLSLRGLL